MMIILAAAAFAGGCLFASLVAYWIRKSSKRKFEKLQQSVSKRTLQAIDVERSRISRELHDSVGQALYSVLVGLKIVTQLKIEESVREHFQQVEQLTAKALDEVKTMASELRPSALDDLGLVPAIRAYLEKYEYTFGISASFSHEVAAERLPNEVETGLYRILQEALINSAKYSNTKQVEVKLYEKNNELRLSIRDFGEGFQVSEMKDNALAGIGLISIRERAFAMGGEALITSEPGQGTIVTVVIPAA